MTELNFQRGKSFAEVSSALTQTTTTQGENGEHVVTSAAENAQRATHHPAEEHPAAVETHPAAAEADAEENTDESQPEETPAQ